MAVLPYDQQTDEYGQPIGQPTTGGGTSTVMGGAPGGYGGGSTQPSGRQGSGSWTNLQRYLDVNRGAGGRMVQQMGSRIAQEGGEIGQQIQQEGRQYGEGLIPAEQKAQEEAAFLEKMRGEGYTPTEEEIQRFGGAELGAETPIAEYAPSVGAQDRMRQYQQRVQQFGTPGGQMAELGRIQRDDATAGQQRLNQLLLQSDPAREQISSFQGLPQTLEAQQAASVRAQQQALQDLMAQREAYTQTAAPFVQEQIADVAGRIDPWQGQYDQQVADIYDPVMRTYLGETQRLHDVYRQDPEKWVRGEFYEFNPGATDANLRERAKYDAAVKMASNLGDYLPGSEFYGGEDPQYTGLGDYGAWKNLQPQYDISPLNLRRTDPTVQFTDWLGNVQSELGDYQPVHQEQARLDALNALLGGQTQ